MKIDPSILNSRYAPPFPLHPERLPSGNAGVSAQNRSREITALEERQKLRGRQTKSHTHSKGRGN